MKDAEELVDRVLYFDGLPNLQRFEGSQSAKAFPSSWNLRSNPGEPHRQRSFSDLRA
jgi:hypothetical protein